MLANSGRRRRRFSNPPRRRRRYGNPLALPLRELLPITLWGIAGGVLSRALPEMFAASYNTGVTGYGLNAAFALVGSYALSRFVSKTAGMGWLIGGATMLVGRIVSDLFGKTLVSYGDVPGLSGDPAFSFSGYDASSFVLPTIDDGGSVMLGPNSVPALSVAGGKSATVVSAASPAALNAASGGGAMPREWAA
jgi:hypothetical protein